MNNTLPKTGLEPYQEIIACVCKALNISEGALISRKKTNESVEARHIIYKILRDKGLKHRIIGEFFDRDHTAVVYGISVYQNKVASKDKIFIEKIELVSQELEGLCEFS